MANSEKPKQKITSNLLPVVRPGKKPSDPGRPFAITSSTLLLLREAFLIGCDDLEACTYAGIAPSTLYEHQKNNNTFSEWKENLKRTPFLKARRTIINHLEHDPEFALKYMERKKKTEFAPQAKITIDDQRETLDDETRQMIGGTIAEHLNKLKEKTDAGDVAGSIPDAN